ncbi:winged helix-turn-helix domain-containing protein [Peribacillus loiseleuriae]|uniref:winged helix-turn-helix domain-containing protein n=1 Tax=Peribacillus loiseleuriae TaxID=1679170 RepID=UPI00381C0FEE
MGKGLHIANTHGWTLERLQAYEKTIQKASMARRIATIRLLMQGYYAIQVAELLNLHRETVSEYVKKFNTSGMEGLLHRKYAPGRRAYLSPEAEQEIRRILEFSTPAEEGYGCESCWDTRILKEVLEDRFSVIMTRGGINLMLKRWGFSYTRPTYALKRADKNKQESVERQLKVIKKLRRRVHFFIRRRKPYP